MQATTEKEAISQVQELHQESYVYCFGEASNGFARYAVEREESERKFVSNSDAYEVFVGSITPEEFTEGYETVQDAVDDFMRNYPYDGNPPSWLEDALVQYVEGKL